MAPFQSKAQAGWMFAHKPAMAKRWSHETQDMEHLPMRLRVARKKRRKK